MYSIFGGNSNSARARALNFVTEDDADDSADDAADGDDVFF